MTNPWDSSPDQPGHEHHTPGMQNPWDNPQDAHPQPTTPPGKNQTSGLLIGLIILLSLVVIAVLAWLFIGGRPGDSTVAETASPDTVTVVVTTQPEAPSATERSTVTVAPTPSTLETAAPTTSQSSARSVERSTTPQPPVAVIPPAAQQAGLTATGWIDNSATRCRGNENLIYAGRDSDAWITVCEGGGQMTYRSNIFGGTLTATVDPARSNPATGEFYVNASPSIIEVVGGGVEVTQGGAVIAQKSFPSAWVMY
ncbi:hypothetical protein [Corynebacterium efficiens YS-314]|uniref:Uncharacterized protein n=1 Tax=Corynebacterium efficiens (strain DSM 44549 / YS-314 / AJ 12310 / JCM 11189 / NBRC 100395) TaxID=196164 RepID=Q8FT08_COREF|nr:hypothetical protein [Corynebacterium efficiens YS-314]